MPKYFNDILEQKKLACTNINIFYSIFFVAVFHLTIKFPHLTEKTKLDVSVVKKKKMQNFLI